MTYIYLEQCNHHTLKANTEAQHHYLSFQHSKRKAHYFQSTSENCQVSSVWIDNKYSYHSNATGYSSSNHYTTLTATY